MDYLLKTGREQENKRTKGRINDRGIWEKTFESETVERTETSKDKLNEFYFSNISTFLIETLNCISISREYSSPRETR